MCRNLTLRHQILARGPRETGLRSRLSRLGHDATAALPTASMYYLVKRKYEHPDSKFTAEDFDRIIGHCLAIMDLQAAVFAPGLVAAYQDVKVVLHVRRDVDAWYRSFESTMGVLDRNPVNLDWVLSWFCRDLFWIRQCMSRTEIPLSSADRSRRM